MNNNNNNKVVFKEGDKVYFLIKESELSVKNADINAFPFYNRRVGRVISCIPNGYTRVKNGGQIYHILTQFVSTSKEEVEEEAKRLNKSTLSRLRDLVDGIEKIYL